jgi:hypothetical protein
MIPRRLRVDKWLGTTPAVGVCTLCSQEFKVPMSALTRIADAQASLQEQFDKHKCEPEHSSRPTDLLLRQESDEEDEDDRKKEDDEDDDETEDGYSE